MLYMIVEAEFRGYPWCQRAERGIWEETRKKRMMVRQIDAISCIPQSDEESGVLLLGASGAWIRRQVDRAVTRGVHPIVLTNLQPDPQDGPMSSVMMDIRSSMHLAIDYLRSLGRTRLALYGCNPHATSDPWRETVFRQVMGPDSWVFCSHGSLESTFESFWQERERFDGVICASDYAAISLMRRLQKKGVVLPEALYIVSYGDITLARMATPSITSISDDYEHFGRAGLSIYNLVVKEKTIASVNILLHNRLQIRQSTACRPYRSTRTQDTASAELPRNAFYDDQEVSDMATAETLLNQCDDTDLEVIQRLIQGHTYARIAESCFISETAVKYRTRKMEKICGVDCREDLVAFLKQYFS